MRSRGRNTNAKINSEIHASLHRLEDANYVNNMIQAENTELLINQTNEATGSLQSQIDDLTGEVYQLHEYIEPHIYQGDLQLFQTLWVGNLQVDDGGKLKGSFTFTDDVSFEGDVTVDGALQVIERLESSTEILAPYIIFEDAGTQYEPRTLTVDGVTLSQKILASDNVSFSWAGLVEGIDAGGNTLLIRTRNSHTSLLSYEIQPYIRYDSGQHKYYAWANVVKTGSGVVVATSNAWSGTEAYVDGQTDASTSYPPNSATFEWFETVGGEAHFRRTGGDFFGRTSRVVYWDD